MQREDNMARRVLDRKIPFNCYLTLSQLEDLEMVSREEGKPKAELVREAITEYLARKANQKRQPVLPLAE